MLMNVYQAHAQTPYGSPVSPVSGPTEYDDYVTYLFDDADLDEPYCAVFDGGPTGLLYSWNSGSWNYEGQVTTYGCQPGQETYKPLIYITDEQIATPGAYAVFFEPEALGPETARYYWFFTSDGTVITPTDPPDPELEAGDITILYPTYATTTTSTTFDVEIGYYIADDLEAYSLNGELPERIGIELSYDNLYDSASYVYLPVDYTIDDTPGAHVVSYEVTIEPPSDYSIVAKLILDYGYVAPYEGCSPSPPFVTCEGYQDTAVYKYDEVSFSNVNGAYSLIGFNPGDLEGRNGLATTTCTVLNLTGCFQNAIAFLFFPDPQSLQVFSFLWQNIKTKPPFGYVTQTITALTQISAAGPAAFTFGSLPFQEEIFDPLKSGLEAMLWLSLIVGFLYRLRELDI